MQPNLPWPKLAHLVPLSLLWRMITPPDTDLHVMLLVGMVLLTMLMFRVGPPPSVCLSLCKAAVWVRGKDPDPDRCVQFLACSLSTTHLPQDMSFLLDTTQKQK